MLAELHEAIVTRDQISIERVAGLIKQPVRHVERLLLGERELAASEVVVLARALDRDWEPLLLCAIDRALD